MSSHTTTRRLSNILSEGMDIDPNAKPEDIFEIVKEIGKGGFGAVYLMKHIQSGMLLAGKAINAEVFTGPARESIIKETDLLRKISTPYTIQYFGNITYKDSPMILMEYCDRGSLRDIMDYNTQQLTEPQAALVVRDLLNGANVLHTKFKILHRDIKAANILVTSNGEIKITDFGVSREFSNDKFSTSTPIGTPYWMAPEVICGLQYSSPADVWSIGATAVELVEGAPPYCELEPNKAMLKISRNGFPGFRSPKTISKEFKDFIAHTMSRDPLKRCTINQLLHHPWIKQCESLNRDEVLKPIIETRVDMKVIFDKIGSKEATTPQEQWINTARNTLRKY